MDASDSKRIEECFQQAAALPPAEREEYLRKHCADPAVRSEVEKLLSKHSAGGGLSQWLDSWVDQNRVSEQAPPLEGGQVVGRYRIESLAHGAH